ncbi:MAG: TAT-variant-translocated molybdopterin oxidoreductase, partial [Ferruginibacter sp.]
MSKKKYWQSFGELNHTESFQESTKNEFQEELLPLADLDDKGILDAKTPRRDFLKYLGFSTAAAAIAASCEVPVRKVVPYLNRPDNVIPGIANYYASTYVNGGDVISVVVKQRDGRPIKIEGNELSTITNGGTSAQAQASVLDLYDNTRLRYPMEKTGQGFKEVPGFDAFDKMIATAMAGLAGKPVVLLTSTINSPTTLEIIKGFIAKYPGSRHVQYDAVSYSGMLQANEACYGKRAIPSYHFDKAKVIVSLGADFLGTWLSPVEFSNQYSKGRKLTGEKPELSKHFQFESMMSLTGSNADDRYTHKPSDTGAVALALLAELGLGLAVPKITDAKLVAGIKKAAAALQASNGEGLVVCGSNDVNVQLIVNAINEQIGANGKTINWGITSNYRSGIDSDMVTLVDEMNTGKVGAVLIYGANPAYSYFDSQKFITGLSKVVSVSFNGTMDETTEQCKYILPSHHWLESWGDAEPKTGYISLLQPTINPLFKTRAFQTSLIKWSMPAGQTTGTATGTGTDTATKSAIVTATGTAANDYETYFKKYWMSKLGSAELYDKALQDGIIEQAAVPAGTAAYNAGRLSVAAQQIAVTKEGKAEIVLYQKVSVGTGSQANNPWLQELPDPVSKVTWDNYAMISPAMAKSLLGLDVMNQEGGKQSDYEVHPEKPVVKITAANGKTVELPVIVIPGMNEFTVALAVGYGRGTKDATHEKISENIGRSAAGAGKNVYHLVSFKETNLYSSMASVEKTGRTYPLAQTQVHGFTESRPVIYETNLTSYAANPEAVLEEVTKERLAIT